MKSVLIPSQSMFTIASEYRDFGQSTSVDELADNPSDRTLPLTMIGLPKINKSR